MIPISKTLTHKDTGAQLRLSRVNGILHDRDDNPRCDYCYQVPPTDGEDYYDLYQMVAWPGVHDDDGTYHTAWACEKCGGSYD